MPGEIKLKAEERDGLVDIIVKQAIHNPTGATKYIARRIRKTNWPVRFKISRASGAALLGDPYDDAERLIDWAAGQGHNTENDKYTMLGGLLEVVIEDVGLEDARWITALIAAHGLYLDERLLDDLRIPVPRRVTEGVDKMPDYGPEIEWEPPDDVEYESWWKPELDSMDHEDIRLMLKGGQSVCRIEFGNLDRPATGFLITDDLLLTSYHVFEYPKIAGDDFDENFGDATLWFGKVATKGGGKATGQEFKPESVVAKSHYRKLDYVLIKVEKSIKKAKDVTLVEYDLAVPKKATPLHLIGHPGKIEGATMKFARCSNAVTRVIEKKGKIQYWTQSAGGSSGSPCFNEDWNVVAMHHAAIGKKREGILLKSIYEEIKQHL